MNSTPSNRVLCINDDVSFLKLYELGLQQYGFNVITASRGMDAWMQFQACEGHFKAIIMDHRIFSRNGSTFLRAIREADFAGQVLLSQFKPRLQNACETYALNAFLGKPNSWNSLVLMLLEQKFEESSSVQDALKYQAPLDSNRSVG